MRINSVAKVDVVHGTVSVFFFSTVTSDAGSDTSFKDRGGTRDRVTCSSVLLVLCMFSCSMRHSVLRAFRANGSSIAIVL